MTFTNCFIFQTIHILVFSDKKIQELETEATYVTAELSQPPLNRYTT